MPHQADFYILINKDLFHHMQIIWGMNILLLDGSNKTINYNGQI